MNAEQLLSADVLVIKAAAAVSGGGSLWLWASDSSVAVVGVPLAVLLAAFAGALFWLSLHPAVSARAAIITVLGSTVGGAMVEPLVQHVFGLPDRVAIALGFLCAFGLQAGALQLLKRIDRWGDS